MGDHDRTRAIFELATSQPALDMPELLWKAYIDFEFEDGQRDRTRALYERLLQKTAHENVWIAFALFEMAKIGGEEDEEEDVEVTEQDNGSIELARKVFESGYKDLKGRGVKRGVRISSSSSFIFIPCLYLFLSSAHGYFRHGKSLRQNMALPKMSLECRL